MIYTCIFNYLFVLIQLFTIRCKNFIKFFTNITKLYIYDDVRVLYTRVEIHRCTVHVHTCIHKHKFTKYETCKSNLQFPCLAGGFYSQSVTSGPLLHVRIISRFPGSSTDNLIFNFKISEDVLCHTYTVHVFWIIFCTVCLHQMMYICNCIVHCSVCIHVFSVSAP